MRKRMIEQHKRLIQIGKRIRYKKLSREEELE